jgi:hypothetical protein
MANFEAIPFFACFKRQLRCRDSGEHGYNGDFTQTPHYPQTPQTSRVLKIIPALRLGSASSELITKLYVVAILKLLAVWESGVY